MIRSPAVSQKARAPQTARLSAFGAGLALLLLVPLCENADAMTQDPPLDRITGQVIGPGAACPQFRLASGETISLSGAYPGLIPGAEHTFSGHWMTRSKCMQGREFRVVPEGE